jgi:hypothetical protein
MTAQKNSTNNHPGGQSGSVQGIHENRNLLWGTVAICPDCRKKDRGDVQMKSCDAAFGKEAYKCTHPECGHIYLVGDDDDLHLWQGDVTVRM